LLLLYRVIWWSIHQPHRQLPSLCRAAMLCATVQSAMDNAPQRLISAGIRSITCLLTRPPLAFSSAIRCGSSPRAEVLLPALPLLLGKSILERKQSECVWPCSNSVGCREFITSALFVWPPGFPLSIMCPRLNNSELQCCTIFLQLTWFSTDLFLNKMKHMIDWLIDWLIDVEVLSAWGSGESLFTLGGRWFGADVRVFKQGHSCKVRLQMGC